MTIFLWIYFWALYVVPLIYVSIFAHQAVSINVALL